MKVEIKGNILHIEIECDPTASKPSKTGKTLSLASTHGNMATTCIIKGKPVVIGLNAYIKS